MVWRPASGQPGKRGGGGCTHSVTGTVRVSCRVWQARVSRPGQAVWRNVKKSRSVLVDGDGDGNGTGTGTGAGAEGAGRTAALGGGVEGHLPMLCIRSRCR